MANESDTLDVLSHCLPVSVAAALLNWIAIKRLYNSASRAESKGNLGGSAPQLLAQPFSYIDVMREGITERG